MNTRQLECFLAVVEHSSIKEAAVSMGMTKPALSKCLAGIAREVGVPLFKRGRHLVLTPAGQYYAEAAYEIMEVKRRTYEMIQSSCSPAAERYSIGVSPHIGSDLFSYVYSQYHEKCPYVQMDAYEGAFKDNIRLLLHGKRDMVIGIESPEPIEQNKLIFYPAIRSEWLVAIAENNPLAQDGALNAKAGCPKLPLIQLQDVPFIGMTQNTFSHDLQLSLARQAGFTPLTVYETSNVYLSRDMTRILSGYTFLPADRCVAGCGLRYFSSDPPCYTAPGFYLRKNLEITDSFAYFLYLLTAKLLENEPLYPDVTCLSPFLTGLLNRFGGSAYV